MNIAIIPARGGSKRIPRKNILPFAGKPMIGYAIEAAQATGVFNEIIVSTDDTEIANIAHEFGAKTPFMRPAELADDHTPTVPVIAHAIKACLDLGWVIDHACCIYPSVPMIEPTDICKALDFLAEDKSSSYAFPVAAFPSAVQRALRRNGSGKVEPMDSSHVSTRTQDLEPAYYDAGQFYWGSRDAWLSGLPIHSHARTIILPEWRVVDIDTPEDWKRAELLFGALRQPTAP